jgi:PAS domain S-box-containing protein
LNLRDHAETIFRALTELSIGVGVVSMDGGTRRVWVNPSATELLGYTAEDLERESIFMPFVPEDHPRLGELLRGWESGGELPARVETVLLTKAGRRVPVEVAVRGVRREGGWLVVTLFFDLSARMAMEEALRQSETRFRHIAEEAPDSIVVISEGRVVYANPAALRTIGFPSLEELRPRPLSELVIDEERALMFERMRRVARGETLLPAPYRGVRKDGSTVEIEISSRATMFGGKPAVLAYGRDISERRRIEAEMSRADRMATIGLLAAGVAHEINNPLTYVLLNLQRLRVHVVGGDATPASSMTLLDEAIEGCDRVARIVRDLLTFSRPGEDVHAVTVSESLQIALRLAAPALEGRARVRRELGDVPPVRAHEGRLAQVLVNLLVNASQAFPATAPSNEIAISSRVEDGLVIVEVIDNGPGIPAIDLERIFDPFFTTKPAGSGTGLGLAVARSIVRSFGGDLRAIAHASGARLRVELRPADPPATRGGGSGA